MSPNEIAVAAVEPQLTADIMNIMAESRRAVNFKILWVFTELTIPFNKHNAAFMTDV